jgi:hypothetical protein
MCPDPKLPFLHERVTASHGHVRAEVNFGDAHCRLSNRVIPKRAKRARFEGSAF